MEFVVDVASFETFDSVGIGILVTTQVTSCGIVGIVSEISVVVLLIDVQPDKTNKGKADSNIFLILIHTRIKKYFLRSTPNNRGGCHNLVL